MDTKLDDNTLQVQVTNVKKYDIKQLQAKRDYLQLQIDEVDNLIGRAAAVGVSASAKITN